MNKPLSTSGAPLGGRLREPREREAIEARKVMSRPRGIDDERVQLHTQTGELVAIVEGYRTAKVAIPEMQERVLEVPVAGETTLIAAPTIFRFLVDSGLSNFLPR